MHGMNSNGHSYYGCRTKGCRNYRKAELEGRVIDEIKKHFRPTDEIKAKFYRLVSDRVNNSAKVEEAKKTNIILSQRISKILNAVQYADPESAVYLLDQVKELKRQMVEVPKIRDIPKAVCDAYIDTFSGIADMTKDEQKTILHKLFSKIIVNDDSIYLGIEKDRGVECLICVSKL